MHEELYSWEVIIVCIHAFDRIQNYNKYNFFQKTNSCHIPRFHCSCQAAPALPLIELSPCFLPHYSPRPDRRPKRSQAAGRLGQRPITAIPLKQRTAERVGRSSTHRPAPDPRAARPPRQRRLGEPTQRRNRPPATSRRHGRREPPGHAPTPLSGTAHTLPDKRSA